jgi:hypothetical protein
MSRLWNLAHFTMVQGVWLALCLFFELGLMSPIAW